MKNICDRFALKYYRKCNIASLLRLEYILLREESASIIHERPLDSKELNLVSSCFLNSN